MDTGPLNRRGFISRLAAAVGGLAVVPLLAQPARAGRSTWRRRFGYGYGYGGWGGYYAPRYRISTHRRFYGPRFYGAPYPPVYGGPRFYGPAYGPPVPPPVYGPAYGPYYPPLLKRTPRVADPLALLEA